MTKDDLLYKIYELILENKGKIPVKEFTIFLRDNDILIQEVGKKKKFKISIKADNKE